MDIHLILNRSWIHHIIMMNCNIVCKLGITSIWYGSRPACSWTQRVQEIITYNGLEVVQITAVVM